MKQQILQVITLVFMAVTLPAAFAADALLPKSPLTISQILEAESARQAESASRDYRMWQVSFVPLFASQALDISSSRGMREANPLLSSAAGTFDARSSLIKLGIVGALAGVEYAIVRKHPKAAKALWKLNFGSAAITSAVAMHNYSIR